MSDSKKVNTPKANCSNIISEKSVVITFNLECV